MTEPAQQRYTMIRRDARTGDTEVILGNSEAGNINQLWELYTDDGSIVEIRGVEQGSMPSTPRPTTTLDHVQAERDELRSMVEAVLSTDEDNAALDELVEKIQTLRRDYETLRENPQLNF